MNTTKNTQTHEQRFLDTNLMMLEESVNHNLLTYQDREDHAKMVALLTDILSAEVRLRKSIMTEIEAESERSLIRSVQQTNRMKLIAMISNLK